LHPNNISREKKKEKNHKLCGNGMRSRKRGLFTELSWFTDIFLILGEELSIKYQR